MNHSHPDAQYRQHNGETPTRLMVMLHDGALRFLGQAVPAMQAHDDAARTRCIGKAQAIIAHLRDTLDFTAGGAAALALNDFYGKACDTLADAGLHDTTDGVEKVIEGLRKLRDAWIEADRRCRIGKSAAPAAMTVIRTQRESLAA